MQTRTPLRALSGALLLMGSIGVGPASGQTVTVTVPGQANPYLAGQPSGARCCGGDSVPQGDSAPNQSPVQVTGIPVIPGTTLTFSVSGSVSYLLGTPPTDAPDGGFFQESPATNGIAGMIAPINALSGVFLDNSSPTASGPPPGLDFGPAGGGTEFPGLCPELKQVFYIGDGRRGHATGPAQRFVVPAGATRLFLSSVDGLEWVTNSGAFSVTVSTGPPAQAYSEIALNANALTSGQTLVATLYACNPPGGQVLDLYVGVLNPDGNTLAFLSGPNALGGVGSVNSPAAVVPMAVLEGGTGFNAVMIEFTLPPSGLQPGTYQIFAAMFRHGALADNAFQDGDLVSASIQTLTYTP